MASMKLEQLRKEIEESAKSLFGEKAYPMTSDWIPITDVLAIVDRFENEIRVELEDVLSKAMSCSPQELKGLVQRIRIDLLG
ncbi:hypothetical protein MUP07_02925 [Candidatus Bathyarchaeota archaeon]|jgi:hypothetical protein|nr:hypothetical protein [Candidatus Bathyarchaeota archaeon]